LLDIRLNAKDELVNQLDMNFLRIFCLPEISSMHVSRILSDNFFSWENEVAVFSYLKEEIIKKQTKIPGNDIDDQKVLAEIREFWSKGGNSKKFDMYLQRKFLLHQFRIRKRKFLEDRLVKIQDKILRKN